MIGGASDSLIGPMHVVASQWQQRARLVAGVFSRDLAKSRTSGQVYNVEPSRCYDTLDAFLQHESTETLDAVMITTPNSTHIPYATELARHGFAVMCEKPLGVDVSTAKPLQDTLAGTEQVFCLAHHNTAYAAVRQIKQMIKDGELGQLRAMRAQYIQGWLADPSTDTPQAAWRLNPKLSGPSCCLADIGSHALNLMQFVSDLKILETRSTLHNFVQSRQVDDFCQLTLKFEKGVLGTMTASQISAGYDNNIELHCDGDKASVSWYRTKPLQLVIRRRDHTQDIVEFPLAELNTHQQALLAVMPTPHDLPNIQAFARLYQSFFDSIHHKNCDHLVTLSTGIELLKIIEDSAQDFQKT